MSPVTVVDVAEHFSSLSVGSSLAKLWTARGCQLEPNLDSSGKEYVCPLTSAPVESPVLLSDGCIYEEANILEWVSTHGCSPLTKAALDHRHVIRLGPWRTAIEEFLSSSNVGYLPSEQLEQAMGEAEMPGAPWHCRLNGLDVCIEQAKTEMSNMQTNLAEAQNLLKQLRAEFVAKQLQAAVRLQSFYRSRLRPSLQRQRSRNEDREVECALILQSRIRSFHATKRLQQHARELEVAVLHVQRWWRQRWSRNQSEESRRKQNEAKAKRRKQKKKAVLEKGPSSENSADKLPLKGVIQQFANVEEKNKRALLDFFLNQLGYDTKHHKILIFASSEQRASGLRSALHMSPSVELPVMLIQQDDKEFTSFKALADTAGIISAEVFEQNVDISHANMLINFDMPANADEYLRRLKRVAKGATAMSFPATSDEVEIIRQVEQRCDTKFRHIQGLTKFKLSENRNALKRRLAMIGSQRQKVA